MYTITDTEQNAPSSVKKPRYEKNHRLPLHAIRILERRYPLTTTGYKYLEIGISVVVPSSSSPPPTPSCVEIVIGDSNKKETLIEQELWLSLIEKKDIIEKTLKQLETERTTIQPMQLGEHRRFSINFGYVNNLPIARIITSMGRFSLSANTMLNLLNLDLCVARIITSLQSITGYVDTKLKQFLEISPDRKQVHLYESDAFDRKSIVDCEIAALYFFP